MPGIFLTDAERNGTAARRPRGVLDDQTRMGTLRPQSFGASGGVMSGGNTQDNISTTNPGRLANSSVNYGAVAGIQNYLGQLTGQARQQAANTLRATGQMGTWNGQAFDQMHNVRYGAGAGSTTAPARGGEAGMGSGGAAGFGQYGDPSNPFSGANGGGLTPVGRLTPQAFRDGWRDTPTGRVNTSLTPQAQAGQASGAYPGGGGQMTGGGMTSSLAGGMGGGAGGAPGGSADGMIGLPLEGQVQGAIGGILDHPSPFSDQQTQMLRNRATSGVGQRRTMAEQQAREDGARRGLNPAEIEANVHALGGQYDRESNDLTQNFDLQNAQATRQGLLGGIGAAGGLMGQQLTNEQSIRQYLAQLQMAQAGQAPNFLYQGV